MNPDQPYPRRKVMKYLCACVKVIFCLSEVSTFDELTVVIDLFFLGDKTIVDSGR